MRALSVVYSVTAYPASRRTIH